VLCAVPEEGSKQQGAPQFGRKAKWQRARDSKTCARQRENMAFDLLPQFCHNLVDVTGVRGRGQKGASTRATYAANARKSWKLRKLNTLMTDALVE